MKIYGVFRIVHQKGMIIATTKSKDLAKRIIKVEEERYKSTGFQYIVMETDYDPLLNGPFFRG